MAARPGDGVESSIDRWASRLAGPELQEQRAHEAPGNAGQPAGPVGTIDYTATSRVDYNTGERDRYDEDYEYYWGGIRIPLWMALIWQVPWRQRLDIFVIGFIIGMVVAGFALLWGFVLSQY